MISNQVNVNVMALCCNMHSSPSGKFVFMCWEVVITTSDAFKSCRLEHDSGVLSLN